MHLYDGVICMFTNKRLTQAYQTAKFEYFDKDSKYIFFSDSHRGDDSLSDEFSRNQNVLLYALDYYYRNGYTYVEAGDGDELWEHSRFMFIRSAHKDIFTAIKKFFDDRRFVFLYGNHNILLKSNKFTRLNYDHYYDEYNGQVCELFPGIVAWEALVLKHRETGQEILTVHGHQGDLMNDQLWFISMFMLRYFWRFMHLVGFRNPASPAKNQYKQHKIELAYNKWIQLNRMMLICGHTHRPKYPRTGELPYFNTGCCIHTRSVTGIEIVNETIMMVDWRVRSDQNGSLQIERTVVRGPDPVDKFDFRNNPAFDNIDLDKAAHEEEK